MKHTIGFTLLALAVNLAMLVNCRAGDLAVAPFGSTNFGAWQITGTAFGSGPVADAQLAKLGIENARDNRVASSELDGD
ncbi:MAG TPA: hypothetical protein VH251_11120, partial [Verrucomicrobiae bacterium]|nr:hypothetical protein [Verrucomicrobiae bacterium]